MTKDEEHINLQPMYSYSFSWYLTKFKFVPYTSDFWPDSTVFEENTDLPPVTALKRDCFMSGNITFITFTKRKQKVYEILLAVSRGIFNSYFWIWSGAFSQNRDGETFWPWKYWSVYLLCLKTRPGKNVGTWKRWHLPFHQKPISLHEKKPVSNFASVWTGAQFEMELQQGVGLWWGMCSGGTMQFGPEVYLAWTYMGKAWCREGRREIPIHGFR